MDFENKRLRILLWIISVVIIIIGTYYWISFQLYLNLMQFWLMGIALSFIVVYVLHKVLKLWQIPIVTIGLDLIYHSQYTSSGDGGMMAYYLVEIPFVILTIVFTIGFFIFSKVKSEIGLSD